VGPQPDGAKQVVVTNANGQSDLSPIEFSFSPSMSGLPGTASAQSLSLMPGLASFAVAGTLPTYYVQGPSLAVTSSLGSFGNGARNAIALDPSGTLTGARCRNVGAGSCRVELVADTNGDGLLSGEPSVGIEVLTGADVAAIGMDLLWDPLGRAALFYLAHDATTRASVAHDRNGDGDFGDAQERVAVETIGSTTPVPTALAVDSAGRVAAAYYSVGAAAVMLAVDRTGDGDFADAQELLPALPAPVLPKCVGVAFDDSDRPAVISASGSSSSLAWDLDADGDFGDANEVRAIDSGAGSVGGCDVAGSPSQPLSVATSVPSTGVVVRSDKNRNGDFGDPGESTVVGGGNNVLDLELDGASHAAVYTALGALFRVATD
jgi:hypothetical protein